MRTRHCAWRRMASFPKARLLDRLRQVAVPMVCGANGVRSSMVSVTIFCELCDGGTKACKVSALRSARVRTAPSQSSPPSPSPWPSAFFLCASAQCCVPNLSLSMLCVVLGGAVLAQVILLRGEAHLPLATAPEAQARAHAQVHRQDLRRHLSSGCASLVSSGCASTSSDLQ